MFQRDEGQNVECTLCNCEALALNTSFHGPSPPSPPVLAVALISRFDEEAEEVVDGSWAASNEAWPHPQTLVTCIS